MAKGTNRLALRGLLVLLGACTFLLGALRILRPLEVALALVVLGLLWRGRRPAVEGVAQANEKFWTVFNGTSDAVFIREDLEFMGSTTFLEANDMACRRLGYTREELLTLSPRDLAMMPDEAQIRQVGQALAEQGHAVFECPIRTKAGEPYPAEIHVHQMTLAGRKVILSMLRDITARTQMQAQLRHAQKLEAVGQLAGGVAHDFNNILQVINGYGTLMQMTMAEQDPNRPAIGEILKAAERAAHLTHSLLAFSRKQIMNPKHVDLNVVVTNVDKFLRRVIGEDIQLKLQRSEEPLSVRVDAGQIEQVLMNLATNARDAMPTGGTLTVTTEKVETDHLFEQIHGFGQAGSYALITVTDTGCGMDESTQKRIFDPFFTTKEMGRGTGLGLSIVYGTIKQHGGYVIASSAQGLGTTIQLYVPLVPQATEGVGDPAAAQPKVKGDETILVVEDEPGVRSMVELVLKKYGYTVLLAEDGVEAVAQFQAHRGRIGLILMDIIMPRKGGRQAFEEIRQLDPMVKVLFTSGYTADFIKSRGELDQEMELVMKPVQPLDLLRRIRAMLDRPLPALIG